MKRKPVALVENTANISGHRLAVACKRPTMARLPQC